LADFATLQQALGVTFNDLSLLKQALVHRSYLNENPDFSLPSNERLEFLGDAFLGFVIAQKLYREFPDLSEGEMTKLRAALVRQRTLARLASSLGLGDYLYMGLGEEATGGRAKQSTLARALEAVVGAVVIDQGFAGAEGFVFRLFQGEIDRAMEEMATGDYKSRLQELVQARYRVPPLYRTIKEEGPDHDKEFTVEVIVNGSVIGTGRGKSKRMAEMDAARVALESFSRDSQ
jgi:ribonuclease III